jgi:CheY-like chemotaxis protein
MPRILVIEDNEWSRDMLGRRLSRRGYQVLLAVDGKRGIAMAQGQSPDLIVMDMSLPEIDGWEATRRLKADPVTVRSPSWPSPRMPWPATGRRPWMRVATTITPNRWISKVWCAALRRFWKRAFTARTATVGQPSWPVHHPPQ